MSSFLRCNDISTTITRQTVFIIISLTEDLVILKVHGSSVDYDYNETGFLST